MDIVKPLRNFAKYGSFSLLPQVDAEHMRPIFEESVSSLSFYSPEDNLDLFKTQRNNLRFHYSSSEREFTWFGGVIYAQEPREDFSPVDNVSYMRISEFNLSNADAILGRPEFYRVIKEIVEAGGIEEVVSRGCSNVSLADAQYLDEIKGFDPCKEGNTGSKTLLLKDL
jgi:hypothetical protein